MATPSTPSSALRPSRGTSARSRSRVVTAPAPGRGRRDDRGIATLEAVLTIPVLVAIFFTVVQVALWWYSRQLASTAAQEAARIARSYTSTAAAGQARGESYLALQQTHSKSLTDVTIRVRRTATTVTVTVTGQTASVVPYLTLHVSETSSGPVERYVPPQAQP